MAALQDPRGLVPGIDPTLVAILAEATSSLPVDWRLVVAAGQRIEIEVLLVDDKQRRLASTSRYQRGIAYDAYRRLADAAYRCARHRDRQLWDRLAWGGRWTTPEGDWCLSHFDLAGGRGRGRYRPP